MSTNVKKRHWAFVLYPESAPADWIEQLRLSGLLVAISPLHDKDIDPTGEPKKPHHHIILSYSGPTTFNVVKTLTTGLNQPIPQALESVRGNYRYFTHMDNPDKYQYDSKDIIHLNGFNIADFMEMTKSEVNQIKKSLHALIIAEDIIEYSDFMDFLLENELNVEYDIASTHTIFFDRMITSRRNKKEKMHKSASENQPL